RRLATPRSSRTAIAPAGPPARSRRRRPLAVRRTNRRPCVSEGACMATAAGRLTRTWEAPGFIRGIFANVDHKQIGIRYIVTSFVFMGEAGAAGLVMRTQLAVPNNTIVSPDHYNEVFTLHGTVM